MRDIWLADAKEMHDAALVLARASQEDDRAALVSAALRLDATCLNCHEVFRQ